MIQFLKGLWKALNQSSQNKEDALTLSSKEGIARFLYDKSAWSKEPVLKPKPKVFYPEFFEGQWETSVCRTSCISEQRIWEIAHKAREPRLALARAELIAGSVEGVGLSTVSAPDLERSYPEHAVIVGWPDEKEKQMALAIQLVVSSSLVFAP